MRSGIWIDISADQLNTLMNQSDVETQLSHSLRTQNITNQLNTISNEKDEEIRMQLYKTLESLLYSSIVKLMSNMAMEARHCAWKML